MTSGTLRSRSRRRTWCGALAIVFGLTLFLHLPAHGWQAQDPPAITAAEQTAEQDTEGAATATPTGITRGKKIVLTDGSFHIVREYRREDDRVRYYSLERSAWEVIPASLVDWPATQKAEAEQAGQEKLRVEKAKTASLAALRADLDIDKSLQVKPGLFLPDDKGLFVIDATRISLMEQEKTSSHLNKSRALGRLVTGIPLISDKYHVEVAGKKATLRIQSAEPEFYFRPDDGREPQISLLRAQVKGDKREIMTTTTNIAGEQNNKSEEMLLQVWDVARGVYRFTVEQALKPGEYALVETTREGLASFVWSFGVDDGAKTKTASEKSSAR